MAKSVRGSVDAIPPVDNRVPQHARFVELRVLREHNEVIRNATNITQEMSIVNTYSVSDEQRELRERRNYPPKTPAA